MKSLLICGAIAGAALALGAQSSALVPAVTPTPPATTSQECPQTERDTQKFLRSATYQVVAPRGVITLVGVKTSESRARGLMCVVRIPPGAGMLFVFPPPDTLQNFWMKNTLVALDMIFVDAHGVVTTVAADIPPTQAGTPDDSVARRNGIGQYVIELGAGDAKRHAIVVGTKLTLPTLRAQPE